MIGCERYGLMNDFGCSKRTIFQGFESGDNFVRGYCFHEGPGGLEHIKNFDKGVECYSKAVEVKLHDDAALYNLGICFSKGPKKDKKKAYDYFYQSAMTGYPNAQNYAGVCLGKFCSLCL